MKLISKLKKIKKYFKPKFLIIIFIGFVALPAAIFAIGTINEGYKVNPGSSVAISAHGTCKKVTNSGSFSFFISTKTSAEWNAFLSSCEGNEPCFWMFDGDCCTESECSDCTNSPNCRVGPNIPNAFCPGGNNIWKSSCDLENESGLYLSYEVHDHKGCHDGNSYWYDTCGSRQGIAESCHGCGCVGAGACNPYGGCCKAWGDWVYAGDCCNWFACAACNLPACRVGPNLFGPVCGVPGPWGGDKNNIWTRPCNFWGWCCW